MVSQRRIMLSSQRPTVQIQTPVGVSDISRSYTFVEYRKELDKTDVAVFELWNQEEDKPFRMMEFWELTSRYIKSPESERVKKIDRNTFQNQEEDLLERQSSRNGPVDTSIIYQVQKGVQKS